MRFRIAVFCCLATLTTSAAEAVERATMAAALHSISSHDLQTHVDVLADDSFEGREAGTRGGRAAGTYLVKYLQERGLTGAAADGGFVQSFDGGYRNILGLIEGSDPVLKEEVVVVGAHYDHVGYGNQSNSFGPFGYVHNGADDNASGVSGLLEIIDAMLMLPEPPRRSILFAFWDGEEKGLLGSKHWTTYPTLSLDRLVFAINVDMIGRLSNNKMEVYGTRSAPGLRRLVSEQNREQRLRLDFSWEMKENSDHYPFFARGMPVLMFHTGLHDDYHRPSDDSHLVNSEGLQRVARFAFRVIHTLSDRDEPLAHRAEAGYEAPADRDLLEEPLAAAPPRLGIRWDEDTQDGLRLNYVQYNSAASRAGLEVGDRLLRFNGQPIVDSDSFRQQVVHAPTQVEVEFVRDGLEAQKLEVQLDGKPTRVGVSWRDDDGEPGTVVFTRIVPASPADLAGLETGDRLYQVGNDSFGSTRELFDLLTTQPSPLKLLVEREGQLRLVELELAE